MGFDAKRVVERVVDHHLDAVSEREGNEKDTLKLETHFDRPGMHRAHYLTVYAVVKFVFLTFYRNP